MRFLGILLFALLGFAPSTSNAEVFINMIGTVKQGNLNGVDLSGTTFSYEAIVLDTTDIDDVFPDTGTFVVDSAILDFGTQGTYDFGSNPGFFNWGLDQGSFYAYSWQQVDVPSTNYDFGFGLVDNNTTLSSFDPAVLSDFGPFTDFDGSFTFDDASTGVFSASNGLGDTVEFSQIASTGVLTVSAVPEPTSLFCLILFGSAATFARRRHNA